MDMLCLSNVGKHDDELHFNVYDEDVAGKDSIGSTKIDLKKHDFSRSAYDAWIKLPALLGLRSNGEIHVKVEYHVRSRNKSFLFLNLTTISFLYFRHEEHSEHVTFFYLI